VESVLALSRIHLRSGGKMSGAELRLSYQPDDEWTGQLYASVRSDAFAGKGSAWFTPDQIKAFVAALRAAPLSPDLPPKIEGGYWEDGKAGVLKQCHLGITIAPYDSRGAPLVRVELATPSQETPERDLQHAVVVRFLTDYAAITRFAGALARIMDGEPEEAALEGTSG
jgi:hypothetical protein